MSEIKDIITLAADTRRATLGDIETLAREKSRELKSSPRRDDAVAFLVYRDFADELCRIKEGACDMDEVWRCIICGNEPGVWQDKCSVCGGMDTVLSHNDTEGWRQVNWRERETLARLCGGTLGREATKTFDRPLSAPPASIFSRAMRLLASIVGR